MPKGVFRRDYIGGATPGDVDAQRLMEQLHAKWAKALKEDNALKKATPAEKVVGSEPFDPERARRSADRARAVIAQKDRARAIIARIADGGLTAQGLSRRSGESTR